MTGLAEFLGRLVQCFDTAGVPYMLSGSMASAVHGRPRATQDLDLVVNLNPGSLRRLVYELPEEAYYVSTEAAREALRRRGQFNVIDLETGWKADLILVKDRPFSRVEFARRTSVPLFGVDVCIATAEDVVLAKLEWAQRSGGSERQLRDVSGILDVVGPALDVAYVEHWARELGVLEVWEALRAG